MEYIKELFNGPGKKYDSAEAARVACRDRASELRKQGYKVKTEKVSFSDLARAESYRLEATK